MTRKAKIITISSTIVVLALGLFIFFRFFFVYSTGVNAGDINYFQKEGILFKTYEGKMIQSGFRSAKVNTTSKHVELRWKRHFGTLPWRGNSQFVVTEILSIE